MIKRKLFAVMSIILLTLQVSTPVFATATYNNYILNDYEDELYLDEDDIEEKKDNGEYGVLPPASVQDEMITEQEY